MSSSLPTERPKLRPEVALEIDSEAANALAAWLKGHAPTEVVECFYGMRALTAFVMETHSFNGEVSADSNSTILQSLGNVVNTIPTLKK